MLRMTIRVLIVSATIFSTNTMALRYRPSFFTLKMSTRKLSGGIFGTKYSYDCKSSKEIEGLGFAIGALVDTGDVLFLKGLNYLGFVKNYIFLVASWLKTDMINDTCFRRLGRRKDNTFKRSD
jgi:hypothetical protein